MTPSDNKNARKGVFCCFGIEMYSFVSNKKAAQKGGKQLH